MAENDLNNAPVVTEQKEDLNNADVVNQQDLNNADVVNQQEQDDNKLADGTDVDKTVPYAKLKEAADARKLAEEQAAYAQRQLELYQANQSQVQQPAQSTRQAGSTYEQAVFDLGLTADDLYGENIIKVQNRKAQLDQALQQQQTAYSANSQFVTSHPDFMQVVGSVNPATGTIMSWSQEALTLQQKKPWLVGAFNTAQGAYEAVMAERNLIELEKNAAANKEHLDRQGIDTASQPLGGSAAGGGAAGDVQNQQMMSRKQVEEIEQKLANGEAV